MKTIFKAQVSRHHPALGTRGDSDLVIESGHRW
jgi:hypothetical protein